MGRFPPAPPHGAGAPPLPAGAAEAASDVASNAPQTFSAWLTSLLPPNPIAAAATGAMMPLILFTLLLALAIVRSALFVAWFYGVPLQGTGMATITIVGRRTAPAC